MKNEDLVRELELIRSEDPEERLRPEAVVSTVQSNRRHPLRKYFTWDTSKALKKLHLIEARKLIARVYVTFTEHTPVPVRVYHSLTTDRDGDDEEGQSGGYRHVQEVLSDAQLRQIMLNDAVSELRAFERRYARLRELSNVIEAAREAREAIEARSRRKKKAKKKKVTKKKSKKKVSSRVGGARSRRKKRPARSGS